MKKLLICLLTLLLTLGLTAFAETTEIVQKELLPETTTTALSVNDFVTDTEYPYETVGYFLDDVAFLGEDTLEVTITFTGNYGSNEYFFSNCYIPVYDYETGKLLDIFYSEVELERPFATSSRTSITRYISTKNLTADIYKIKVIMLESLTSLRPNCPVPYLANELVIAKDSITAKIPTATITSVLHNVPLSKEDNWIVLSYNFNQIKLSDTAVSMGYTPDMIHTTIFTFDNLDLKPYVGLTCDFEVDLTDLVNPKIISVTPTEGKNTEIVVNPELLQETNYSDGYIEYKKDINDEKNSIIKVPSYTELTIYKNLVAGAWTDVAIGGNVGDIAYRFVDTNGDAIYDTVFVDNVSIFVVGYVNTNTNRIFRDTTSEYAMSTFAASSITLDPENEFINWNLTDKEGNPIELSDIEVGSVAAVAYSCDGACDYYDIVISNDTVEGQVAETYKEYDKTYYRINGESYTLLDWGMDGIIMPGDAVKATVYGNTIVNFTVDKGIRYGVVLATNIVSDFGTTYQVQVLNQDGKILTLNMADKVNGYVYNGYDFSTINGDDIIIYQVNHQGEIIAFDVEESGSFQTNNLIDSKKLVSNTEGSYRATTQKIDSYYLTDETVIVTTSNTKGSNDGDDYAMETADILEEDKLYSYTLVYNSNKDIEFVVLYCQKDEDQYPDDDMQNEIHYGVVIATNVASDFGTTYQLQILNQDGEVEVLNLADKVNGATPSYTTSTLNTAFPKGTWMAYRLNSEGDIGLYDHSNYPGTRNVLATDDRFVTVRGNCSNSNIANYQIVAESKLTGTEVAASDFANISTSNCGKIDVESFDSDKTYEADMIINNNQEILFAFVHETTPITDEADDMNPVGDIQYGIVLATNVATDYGTTYQLQILKQDGQVDVLQMAEKVNGYTYIGSDFQNIGNDDIIAYQLNSSGEIVTYDVGDDSFTTNFFETDHQLACGDNGNYHKATQRLDYYYINDNTVIITTVNAKGFNTKNDYMTVSIDALDETESYTYTVVYDENDNAKFLVLYQAAYQINMNTDPFVITKTATVTVDGEYRTKYYGYMNGEVVEFIASENFSSGLLAVNDVAMIAVNQKSEITNAVILAKYSSVGYRVIDNASNAPDDEKYATAGTEVNIHFAPTFDTSALNTFFTYGTTDAKNLKGFGAAGKAYQLRGNMIQLVRAFDYPNTFDGNFRYYGVNDAYISDYFIDSDTVAYIYNVRTGKIQLGSVLGLATEMNTGDCFDETQVYNDDTVYVYNYDGDTKLILIVDVNGDN